MGTRKISLPRLYWSMNRVRELCQYHGWYNNGAEEDFNTLLTGLVMKHCDDHTQLHVYFAAEDIAAHTVPAPDIPFVWRELEKKTLLKREIW